MTVFENLKAVLDEATARVTLSATNEKAKARLKEAYTFQEETFFGTVLTKTGGIVIDDWIRIYGSGAYDFYRRNVSLSEWNAVMIAEDIVGGLFSLDSNGMIRYFAPDTLQWENLDITYRQFIQWAVCRERADLFYETFRWDGWENDAAALSPKQGILCYPPLWSKERKAGFQARAVPVRELFGLPLSFAAAGENGR